MASRSLILSGPSLDNAPQVTRAATLAEIPTTTPASDALSKALKKRGFKFVGSTICYSFMQACGLVNDHVTGCFCHPGGQDDPASGTLKIPRRCWRCGWTARFMPILFYQRKLLARQRRGSTGCLSSAASTWVWEQDGELKGFVSVLDSAFVGALFVAPGATRQGIGRALLDEVKQHYAWLSLEVYQKNESAVSFYHAQGFRIEDCAWQDDTQHPTWIMRWPADQMP